MLDCVWHSNNITTSNISSYMAYWNATANTLTKDGDWIIFDTDASKYSSTYMQISPKGFDAYTNVPPLKCEIEVDSVSNYVLSCPVLMSDNNYSWNNATLSEGRWRVETTDTTIKVFKNDIQQWSKTFDYGAVNQRIYLQSTRATGNGSIKFKNWLIYPF